MNPSKIPFPLSISLVLALQSSAHPEYRARIPNAMNMTGVEAIGHIDKGHGARNAFGRDFSFAGKKWTVALCQKDSGGDGQTNGQELGDPCCQWVQASNEMVRWVVGVSASPNRRSGSTQPAHPQHPREPKQLLRLGLLLLVSAVS
jgi:hypothetical protein